MDGGAWWAAVHGVAKSGTRLSDFTFTFHFHALEREMATHSSVFAWRSPGTGDPCGLLSLGSHRVGYDWRDLATAAPPTPKGEEWILGSRDPWEPVLTATCYHLTFQPSQTTQLLQTSLKIIKKLVVNLLSNFKWLNSLEFWKLDSLIAQLVHVDVWQNQYNIVK